MTIRRRLILAFATILALFAINQVLHIWSDRLRTRTMTAVDRALQRQLLLASVNRRISDLHRQMSLLGQIELEPGQRPTDQAPIDADIDTVSAQLRTLEALADPPDRAAVGELQQTYLQLADAWRRFYDYFGVEQGWALAFQVRAEPLVRRVINDLLPSLQKQQNERVQQAQAEFAAITRWTEQLGLGIFTASMLIAAAVAYLLSRHLTGRLSELEAGVTAIGTMNLDHRVPVNSKDELGTVAAAVNAMAASLSAARAELRGANDELVARNTEIDRQRQISDSLLLNILPQQVAAELAERGEFAPRYFEDVTILFTDFVGFSLATERLAAGELVGILHGYFKAFDEIAARYGLEKMKTIGDSYFCAGGLPVRTPSHPVDATLAALEMIREVERRVHPDGTRWAIRIGLHTGPVVAGVVGTTKFAFDVWGETVNLASRMETAAQPNRVNVSSAVQQRIKDFFALECRGLVRTKEHREFEMYGVLAVHPALIGGDSLPPAAFAERYRTYFGKELTVFPADCGAVGS